MDNVQYGKNSRQPIDLRCVFAENHQIEVMPSVFSLSEGVSWTARLLDATQ